MFLDPIRFKGLIRRVGTHRSFDALSKQSTRLGLIVDGSLSYKILQVTLDAGRTILMVHALSMNIHM